MSLVKNQKIELYIESLANSGSGVARFNGQTVFVDGAVPGDKVLAIVKKAKKTWAQAQIIKLLMPSEDRIESECKYFRKCGGCTYQNMSYAAEKSYKLSYVNDCLKHIGGIDITVDKIITSEIKRYRNKAEYPVRMKNGKIQIGFYKKRTHEITEIDDCFLEPEIFKEIIKIIKNFLEEFKINAYDEVSNKGLVRHIFLRKAEKTGEIACTLVINGEKLPFSNILVKRLSKIKTIKSIALNINKEKTNVILGYDNVFIFGKEYIEDELLGIKLKISPNTFYQVNYKGCEKLYMLVREFLKLNGTETFLDLYCGAGSIGLTLADKVKKLYGVEIVESAIQNAKENANLNGINNTEFLCSDAAEAAKFFEKKNIKIDVIAVDPPRKGISEELIETITRFNPKKLVYVSCDPATLARDLKLFAEKSFAPSKITCVDMFPRTTHVECIALIQKVKS
ncbi:MAG: 23S rRNA (uracil(1939)-C(5))-methyltransferase RlmD [Candidatus Fimenecus sp.]